MVLRDMANKDSIKKSIFFILKFLCVFLLLSWFFNLEIVSEFFINFFVWIMKSFIFIIGKGTTSIVENNIVFNSVSMLMTKECTGAVMYALFIAFVLAYGISKKTWKYGVYGLLILISLNILRLFTLLVSTFFGEKVFYFIHDFLWPSTFFVFTLIAILFYIKGSSK